MFYDKYIELCSRISKKPYSVAKELGLSNSNVAQWKKGSTPRPEVMNKISEYFGVSVSCLMGYEEKEQPALVSESRPLYPPEYDLLSPEDRALVDNMIRSLAKKKSFD